MGKKRGKKGDVALRKRQLKKQQSILRNELIGFREAREEAYREGYEAALGLARETVAESRTIAIARKRVNGLGMIEDESEEAAS